MVDSYVDIDTKHILGWLEEILDPEIPVVNIIEMGIVRNVELDGYKCVVTITPTYTACPAMKYIEDNIVKLLLEKGLSPIVKTVFSPAWTTDWMPDSAKKKLESYGIAPPKHSSCLSDQKEKLNCPHCKSNQTKIISLFGSTACKSLWKCESCLEPFEHFKCH